VLSIDLLSVKLRTLDNLYVRIPNETLIKSEVRTLTRFPIRRIDLSLSVAYEDDLSMVHRVLLDVADRNPMILDEPKPLFVVLEFQDSGVGIQFSPWIDRRNLVDARNLLKQEILEAFREAGIEIPFPQRSLRAGRGEPLPVRLVDGPSSDPPRGD